MLGTLAPTPKKKQRVARVFLLLLLGGGGLTAGLVAVVVLALVAVIGGATRQKEADARRAEEEKRLTPSEGGGARSVGAPSGPVPSGGAPIDVGAPDPALAQNGFARTRAASIDFDGDPHAYAPADSGLPTSDFLGNAGRPGYWWALKTDNGSENGNPVIGPGGYYISMTSLLINGQPLNAQRVPFVALPRGYQGAKLGDYALVTNETTGQKIWAIYGDVSPRQERSELSAAAARAVGVGFEKRGTTSNAGAVTITIYPGSRNLELLRQRIGGG